MGNTVKEDGGLKPLFEIGVLVAIYGIIIGVLFSSDAGKKLINNLFSTEIMGVPESGLIVSFILLFGGLIGFILIMLFVKWLIICFCQAIDNYLKSKYNPKLKKITIKDLTRDEITLYSALLEYERDKTNQTTDAPNIVYFHYRTGLDIDKIKEAVDSLDKKNLIQIHRDPLGPRTEIYTIHASDNRQLILDIEKCTKAKNPD